MLGLIIALWNKQSIVQRFSALTVLISEKLESIRYLLDHSGQFGVTRLIYKVDGNQNYNGVAPVMVDVTISRKPITPTVTITPDNYEYTGNAIQPSGSAVKVTDGSDEIPASEYTLSYGENIHYGTGTVTATDNGSGNYAKSSILSGMALFLKTYETELVDQTFIKRLSMVDPEEIIRRGKVDFSTNKAALRFARVILSKYNGQRGGRKLPYRFKG